MGSLGFIGVIDKETRDGIVPFGESDEHVLELMGQQAGMSLSNARLYRRVEEEKNLGLNILASVASGVISTFSHSALRTSSGNAITTGPMRPEVAI